MKGAALIALAALAGLAVVGFALWRRQSVSSTTNGGGGLLADLGLVSQPRMSSGERLSGTAQNTTLAGEFNLGTNTAFNLGPAERFDLSGQGTGSGFFTRSFQLPQGREMP